MITITICADEPSRTPERPCAYDATTEVEGVVYIARHRYGAAHAIARQLVAAGIADQPVAVLQPPQGYRIAYPSLHRMAGRTIAESATHPVHGRRWVDPAETFGRSPPTAHLLGVSPSADIPIPETADAAVLSLLAEAGA